MLRAFALVVLVVAGCGDEIPLGPAIYCWDRNGSSTCDSDEDVDLSGACDVDDCQGAIGPAGPTGATGSAGAAGANGVDGVEGPAGPQGPQGDPGPIGAQGDLGPAGPEGPMGPMGLQGPMGPIGPQGPAGADGADGAQGPQGAEGDPGPTGATGATGPAGAPGADGTDGLACWDLDGDGACNPIAEDNDGDFLCTVNDCMGPRGPAGPVGQDGPAGPQGPQGPQGPAGPQGPPGEDGQDGSPDTPAQVLAKLLSVDGAGSGISADFLDGIDSATLLGRFAAIEARLDEQEEPVSVLGATAFTSDGAVSYSGAVGLAAVKAACIDEFGAGARACSFTDVADALANGDVLPPSVIAWLPRDASSDLAACKGMTTTAANGLAISIDAAGVIDLVAGVTCGGTHPFMCCRGHR